MSFGARLAEERKRLGFKQAEFAALVGVDVPKQSLYENNRRELRAPYLARLAAAEVDVGYVLTGRRSEDALGDDATALVTTWLGLPNELRDAVQRLLDDLERHLSEESSKGRS
jgi:transcriptional regulator with XRE-family HTH domain